MDRLQDGARLSPTDSDLAPTPSSDPSQARLPRPEESGRPLSRYRSGELGRRALVLLVSLLLHALLLSLTFGGQPVGIPGFDFAWRERKIEAPDLRIVRVRTEAVAGGPANAPVAAQSRMESIEQPVAAGPAPTPPAAPKPPLEAKAAAILPEARPTAEAEPTRKIATGADRVQVPLRAEGPRDSAPPVFTEPSVAAVKPPDAAVADAPATGSLPTSVPAAERSASSPETMTLASRDDANVQKRSDPQAREQTPDAAEPAPAAPESRQRAASRPDTVREEAARLERQRQEAESEEASRHEAVRREAERVEAERREAERQRAERQEAARREAERVEVERLQTERREAAQQEAARREAEREESDRREVGRQEAARQEAVRREAERVEAGRRESERREAERREAARQEAVRREAERVEAGRREAERQEAARQEAARQEAARTEAARQAAARDNAARIEARKQEEARREERLRAIGRQLDEEAAQRDAAANAARPSSSLPLSLSTARRARLWGRADANAEIVRYAEAWERKIQLNTPLETVRELAQRPHNPPMVTVAIRSNGSVESVTLVNSSGMPDVDEAIRRIVRSHENYPAFPPALAREFDVIEIRRTWRFDSAIRLY